MSRLITTFFGVGLLKPAPGTWGSAAAIPVAYGLHVLGSFPLLVLATLVVIFVGWWATMIETRGKENDDPSEIVIDEVVGQWIALWPVSAGMMYISADPWLFPYPGWIVAFLAFRLFDIWKIGPIGWADRLHSPLGVMLDDVLAGLLAAVVVGASAYVAHAVFVV